MSSNDPSNAPIFIVGVPRSGTTLLSAMLSSHSRIAIAPETHFIAHNYRLNADSDLRNDSEFQRIWLEFIEGDRFVHLGVSAQPIQERLLQNSARSFADVFSETVSEYSKSVGKPRWGEKTPGHYLHVETILNWFPDSRVIFLVRDPRAVCASLLKAPFGNRYVTFHCARWHQASAIYNSYSGDSRVALVKYEHLVRDSSSALRHLCGFLGERFEEGMIDRSNCSMPNLREGWGNDHMEKAISKEVTTASLDKWRSQLSAGQVRMIEKQLGSEMESMGYEVSGTQPGALTSCRIIAERLVSRLHLGVRRHWNERVTR